MTNKHQDRTGQRFGRLLVVSFDSIPASGRGSNWLCQCDCGSEKIANSRDLVRGQSKSCGCLRAELTGKRFKLPGTISMRSGAEYLAWYDARRRCFDKKNKSYVYYGARGITMCSEWADGRDGKSGFEIFLKEMGVKPSPELTLDRINNDGDYEPGNCRWATMAEQAANKRPRSRAA